MKRKSAARIIARDRRPVTISDENMRDKKGFNQHSFKARPKKKKS